MDFKFCLKLHQTILNTSSQCLVIMQTYTSIYQSKIQKKPTRKKTNTNMIISIIKYLHYCKNYPATKL